MPVIVEAPQTVERGAFSRLVRAALLLAVVDGLFSSILVVVFYKSTVTRLWQRVASTLLGNAAIEGGTNAVLIGLLMHLTVAFTWSAVFLFLVLRLRWIQNLLASRNGIAKVAALYGPFIWIVMSLAVIPVLTRTAPVINYRWWVQFFGHIPFVGVPIVATLGRRSHPANAPVPGAGLA